MSDNPELAASAASIDATLKDLASFTEGACEGITAIFDELSLIRRAAYPIEPGPRETTGWPWAPGTIAQGFLGARWNRRDGNVYATGALRAGTGPNSPIRGGDDAGAAVDVPSGARRTT